MTQPDPVLLALLRATIACGGSDLHLAVGRPPTVRRDGTLVHFENAEILTPEDTARIVSSVLTPTRAEEFQRMRQVDFSFGVEGVGRFRANAFSQRGSASLALRVVPHRVRPLDELGAPEAVTRMLRAPYGLVLSVGPTGSGKSTTLAAMIDRINSEHSCHILTIEDPIEYLHVHKRSLVNQREVGSDVVSFEEGLRAALREDPDVILLGEMRDLETISIALTLAETGHLVFASLHTNDAAQAIDRIVDAFPADKRDHVQLILAGTLQGVISQRLLRAEGGGRVAAYEVLRTSEAVRNLIREGKTRQIRNVMTTSAAEGMQTLEMDLARLVSSGLVSMATACSVSAFPKEIETLTATTRSQAAALATRAAGQMGQPASGVLTR